ncbi:MAG: hypothetical protein COT91_03235 [Candidatus Doudnabacteria bacterium CG10_big_fil_rev_8_21_14_0_10_41_10]|uniref:EamA domain-containing protein n=1 Tax=Candidatus Doudnabacteria bacterium CG10_big_fil_rev_8_21_14_0_10_41_10 TaxID=1974551 RepID=A0A2H0VFM5_9BACT|nr:MAG: hypothetical protein COT91_03235 [Candidatus Doudnabacteria bacterium CG10_big_fil_rev_8_21_14_0_10_41_10]
MNTKYLKYATYLALLTALISGTNNFLTKIAVTVIPNPIVFTTLKNGIVALAIIGIIISFSKWKEIKTLSKKQIGKLMVVGVIGGFAPFALFFTGLTMTSGLNAGLIHKTLFLWVLILAVPILKEKITKWQLIGIVALFSANFVIGGFQGFKFNIGELMILVATILWAIENIIAKIALRNLSSLTVAGARMTVGSALLLSLVAIQGNLNMFTGLSAVQWSWTLLTSLLLTGFVLTWYTALKYAPATYVATLLVVSTLVTNVLTTVFITHNFNIKMALSVFLFYLGAELVIKFKTIPQPTSYQLKTKS